MLTIDGSFGEGGGQILRSALALSLLRGLPIRIEKIRAGRKRPGLRHQHLTAVEAATKIGRAKTRGARLGSQELEFRPRGVTAGKYSFSVGTAGSATLVLQTVLPPLLESSGTSHLFLEGGTHNPFAPPFDFLARTFLPLVVRLGPNIDARLDRHGFYPSGGGRMQMRIEPSVRLTPFELNERGPIRRCRAKAVVSGLPRHVAERELTVIRDALTLDADDLTLLDAQQATGPGNFVAIDIQSEHLTEVVSAFGKRGVPAEAVAEEAVRQAREYLDSNVPVGRHLADQLLLPLAMAGGGSFVTMPLSPHTRTNVDLICRFLAVDISTESLGGGRVRIEVQKRS